MQSLYFRPDKGPKKTQPVANKKNRPKDVFGPPLPTEEEFEILKNAPRYIPLLYDYF
jgi:CBF1 interacting corepressor